LSSARTGYTSRKNRAGGSFAEKEKKKTTRQNVGTQSLKKDTPSFGEVQSKGKVRPRQRTFHSEEK